MPYKAQRSWWDSATGSEKIAKFRKADSGFDLKLNCPHEIWTEHTSQLMLFEEKLKFMLCCWCLSENIPSLWGMSWHSDTLFSLLDGRVGEKAVVFRAHGPWQVSESCQRICESSFEMYSWHQVISSLLTFHLPMRLPFRMSLSTHGLKNKQWLWLVCQPSKMKLLCKQPWSSVQSY